MGIDSGTGISSEPLPLRLRALTLGTGRRAAGRDGGCSPDGDRPAPGARVQPGGLEPGLHGALSLPGLDRFSSGNVPVATLAARMLGWRARPQDTGVMCEGSTCSVLNLDER